MAIVCTPSVSAAQQAKGQEHKAAGHTQTAENQAGGNPFLALLQGVEDGGAQPTSVLTNSAHSTWLQPQSTHNEATGSVEAAATQALALEEALSVQVGLVSGVPSAWIMREQLDRDVKSSADTLLNEVDTSLAQGHQEESANLLVQAKLSSQRKDMAYQDVASLTPQMPTVLGGHLGQPPQGLLTASLGVQQDWSAASSAAGTTALAEMTQQEAASVREQDMQAALEQANFEPTGSEAERVQASDAAPGRIALQGMQEVSSASLQAQAPQVAQWVAQWLASPRQTATPSAGAAAADAADPHALAGLQEGGGRLTEQAVQATQASADAQLADTQAQEQARQEDLRFWLRGQQQRAEVVLQRDGQPVRVQVQIQGQEAHVVLRTDQEAMRTLLGEGLEQLRAMLSQQGVQLAGVDVQADGGRQARVPLAPSGWGTVGRSTVQVAPGDLPAVPSAARVRGQLNVYV